MMMMNRQGQTSMP